jgi:DNA-binding beta-propeller fold protein YncE
VTCYDDGTVQRIDPKTNRVVATIRVGQGMDGLLVDGDHLWTVGDRDQTIYRIDVATNSVVAAQNLGSELRNPAVGAGSLWVPGFGSDQVFRITPS